MNSYEKKVSIMQVLQQTYASMRKKKTDQNKQANKLKQAQTKLKITPEHKLLSFNSKDTGLQKAITWNVCVWRILPCNKMCKPLRFKCSCQKISYHHMIHLFLMKFQTEDK